LHSNCSREGVRKPDPSDPNPLVGARVSRPLHAPMSLKRVGKPDPYAINLLLKRVGKPDPYAINLL